MIKSLPKRVFATALCAVLMACSSPISQSTASSPAKQPQLRPASTPAVQGRTAVRNFLAVVDAVEPVAEAECRARTRSSNCDFKIVVDDRPGLPPNAYQTLDETNRPILAFTIPLIAGVENQDEMAFIMAHEAAHHIRGHLARLQQNATIGAVVAGSLAGVLGRTDPEAIEAAQQFGATLGARSYSKDFELEADELGTVIAAKAGYNPLIGAEFFFRIPNPGDRFLGTHPANEERVATVRRTAALYGYR
ncbi:MAG: M48 family metallopeptidase [Pseudomonadota bacterium]